LRVLSVICQNSNELKNQKFRKMKKTGDNYNEKINVFNDDVRFDDGL
jgi:hypothetical protein